MSILRTLYIVGIVLFIGFVISQNTEEPDCIRNIFVGSMCSLVWPIVILFILFTVYVMANGGPKIRGKR